MRPRPHTTQIAFGARTLIITAALSLVGLCVSATPALAQSNGIGARGFFTVGSVTFTAKDSFDAVLGSSSGVIFGGGGQITLPWGIFIQVAASQFKQDGERVFVGPDDEVFPLGIPLEITITPIEVTGGLRFGRWQRVNAYAGGGYSSYAYKEESDFAEPGENVDERFSGFHVMGGVEYQVQQWVAIGGEVAWASIPDALGQGGASAAFGEDNLGGTTIRLKISIGR